MAGKSRKKSMKPKACTSSVHKKGHFVVVKARCHVGKAKLVTPSMCKHLPHATKHKTKSKVKKHRTPAECKGLKGRSLTECKRILHKEYVQK